MAEFLGLSLRSYQRLEAGEAFPQEATLRQITSKLGVTETAMTADPADSRPRLLSVSEPHSDRRDPEASAPTTRPSTLLGDIVFMLTALDKRKLRLARVAVERVRDLPVNAIDETESGV